MALNPHLMELQVWNDVLVVLRNRTKLPYHLNYPLPPNTTYGQHGRDMLFKMSKENFLCCTKVINIVICL